MARVLLTVNDVQAGFDIRAALRSAGHIVFLEFDPRDAIRILEDCEIDLVACDAVLPGMFGTDLIIATRATLKNPGLPAVLLGALPPQLEYELLDTQPLEVLASPTGEQVVSVIKHLASPARCRGVTTLPSGAQRLRLLAFAAIAGSAQFRLLTTHSPIGLAADGLERGVVVGPVSASSPLCLRAPGSVHSSSLEAPQPDGTTGRGSVALRGAQMTFQRVSCCTLHSLGCATCNNHVGAELGATVYRGCLLALQCE